MPETLEEAPLRFESGSVIQVVGRMSQSQPIRLPRNRRDRRAG